ncbi:hypothetical protein [Ralstonia flatus]|uniref:Transmembrane protein n=1 Tax=Ralstonia flatus TaxID=3058601 RepID=A0AAD2BZL4_9RALS|nr:hypothetical protein [Ralstonia sp. LMG 32965]CAJ0881379.1 hypothetical protein R77567_03383 [Ralstonia sp. LMG 32965]CAJ0893029.1 hypothetical protein R77564_03678 [Ralstonia sp. LMG 32965]
MEAQKARKPLTDRQMAKAISIVVVGGAIPLYLAIKGNPWPCAALIVASWVYLPFRRRQLNK